MHCDFQKRPVGYNAMHLAELLEPKSVFNLYVPLLVIAMSSYKIQVDTNIRLCAEDTMPNQAAC